MLIGVWLVSNVRYCRLNAFGSSGQRSKLESTRPYQKKAARAQLHWSLATWKSGPILPDLLILFNGIWKSGLSCAIFCLLNAGSTS